MKKFRVTDQWNNTIYINEDELEKLREFSAGQSIKLYIIEADIKEGSKNENRD